MIVAIDFETHLICKETPIPKPICLSAYNGKDTYLFKGDRDIKEYLTKIFTSSSLIIAHNTTFELSVIYKYYPELRPLIFSALRNSRVYCTKLYERLLSNVSQHPKQKFDLATLVKDYFDEDISETKKDPEAWRLRYHELENKPLEEWPEAAKQYAIDDSIYAYKIQHEQSKAKPLKYRLAVSSEFCLNLWAKKGFLIDQTRTVQLEKEMLAHLQPRRDFLISQGMAYMSKAGNFCKKSKEFSEYISKTIPRLRYTKKGSVSTKGEHLDDYLAQMPDDATIKAFLDMKEYEKALTSYVRRLKQADPYIYTDYNSVVSTGRTSSSQSNFYPSVQIQNQPRSIKGVTWDIRNCYVPRQGYKLVSIDYSGLELTSCAHQLYLSFGASHMRQIINGGDVPADMHSMLASEFKGCSYEEFKANKKKPEYAFFRQLAKPIGLGFPGGIGYDVMRSLLLKDGIVTKFKILETAKRENDLIGAYKILCRDYDNIRIARMKVDEYAIVYDELVGLKKKMFKLYPELHKFLKTEHERFQTGEKKYVKNDWDEWEEEPMHRYEVAGTVRDFCTYTALCNGYLMQSPSATGAKNMVWDLTEKFHASDDIHLLAFIHDEVIFEVKDNDRMYANIDSVAEVMIDSMQQVLYSVRVAVEASVMNYWSKSTTIWDKTYWKDPKNPTLRTLQ